MRSIHRSEEDIRISLDENDEEEEAMVNRPQHELLEIASMEISRWNSQIQDYSSEMLHEHTDVGGDHVMGSVHSNSSQLRRLSLAVKGAHYAEFQIGRPPQKVKLAISINSPYSIFPCSTTDCKNNDCGYSGTFDAQKSGTFRKVGCGGCGGQCENNVCLEANDDWESYIARDYFVTKKGSIDIAFGCQTFKAGFLNVIEETANGILGLATASTSHVNQLNRAKVIDTSMFSLCFRRYPFNNPSHAESYESAGTLDLGGYDSTYLTSPVVWMTNTGREGKYTVEIKNVFLRAEGGLSVQPDREDQEIVKLEFNKRQANRGPGTVIETTSPVTLLNVAMENSFKLEFMRMVGKAFSYDAMEFNDAEVLNLPTILVQLKTSANNQSLKPDEIIGMVGTKLDPTSPTDLLLAIPAISYLHKREDGKYKSLLSVNHNNGSILGSNAFQGRHVVFTTGYSTDSSNIGIAETEKCTSDDEEFSSVMDLNFDTNTPTLSPEVSVLTFSPTVNPQVFSPNYPVADTKEAFDFWPIVAAGILFVGAVVILLLAIAIRRKRKEKKTEEDETGDSDGSYDAGSFVSYGLRSHLFSIASSKHSTNGPQTGPQSTNANNPALENARMMDIEASAGLISSERQRPQQSTVPKQEPNRVGNASLSREPLLPQAQPVIQAQPVFNENPPVDGVRRKSSGSDRNSNKSGDDGKLFKSRRSSNLGSTPADNGRAEKTFLVQRGAQDSSEEEQEQSSVHTREMARRQLQMLVGKRGSDPLMEDNRNREQARNKNTGRRQTMSMGTQESSRPNSDRERPNMPATNDRRNRRPTMDLGGHNSGDRRVSKDRRPTMDLGGNSSSNDRRSSKDRRPTMDMKQTGDRRGQRDRRPTMDMKSGGDHRTTGLSDSMPMDPPHSSSKKPRTRRATMNMSSQGHTLDPSAPIHRPIRRSSLTKPRTRRPTMDMTSKNMGPRRNSFKSSSKMSVVSKSSKVSRTSKAISQSHHSRMDDNRAPLANDRPYQGRYEQQQDEGSYAHPAVTSGTVIHVAEESSVVSGLSFGQPHRSKHSISVSRHSNIGTSRHTLDSDRPRRRGSSSELERPRRRGSSSELERPRRRGSSSELDLRRSAERSRRSGSVERPRRRGSSAEISLSHHSKRYSSHSESENSSKYPSNESLSRSKRYGSRENLSSFSQYSSSHHNHMSVTSDEDSTGINTGRIPDRSQRRRQSLLMATIKEDPSRRSMAASNRNMGSPSRGRYGNEHDDLDREIESRGLPAAPSYRIMSKGNNDMW